MSSRPAPPLLIATPLNGRRERVECASATYILPPSRRVVLRCLRATYVPQHLFEPGTCGGEGVDGRRPPHRDFASVVRSVHEPSMFSGSSGGISSVTERYPGFVSSTS